MGREIKRVKLDFNWQLGKVWGGYVNPFLSQSVNCPACGGSGQSPDAAAIRDEWYRWPSLEGEWSCNNLDQEDVDALLAKDRLWDFTRVPVNDEQRKLVADRVASGKHNSWLPFDNGRKPTAAEVNEWSKRGMGHDSINCWIVVEAKCKRLGLPLTCSRCGGESTLWPSPEIKAQYEGWKPTEPPRGRGYQLWETVSEGSPISPVFKQPEDLAQWLVESPDYKWRKNDAGTTYKQWLAFIRGPGWAPSAMSVGGKFMTGVQAVVGKEGVDA